MSLMIVAGTRPEIIKLAPVLWNLRHEEYTLVWSGQHYDFEMSKIFFHELEVPNPDVDLGIGNGSHAEQTAKAMIGLERVINERRPRMVVALGDTNTALAAALASTKSHVPFVHLEAGMRSWDRTMPEEINRIVADHVADILFAFTRLAQIYLVHEGIPYSKIFVTGSTEVDVIRKYESVIDERGKELIKEQGLNPREYVLITVHRQASTDDQSTLSHIISALVEISRRYQFKVVFPVHPRTKKAMLAYSLEHALQSENILLLPPLGFFEFLGLLKHARVVLTDSGGVQVDACTFKVPTVVLRYNTEYPECIAIGASELAGTRKEDILSTFERALTKRISKSTQNPLGDGRAGERIAQILYKAEVKIEVPDLRTSPLVLYRLVARPLLNDLVLAWYDRFGRPLSHNGGRFLVRRKHNPRDFDETIL